MAEYDEIALENQEWLDALDDVLRREGPDRVRELLRELSIHAHERGVRIPFTANTPYINTIPANEEKPYPGSREIERRLRSIIRWNAMAMVVRANREHDGIGGHISTYASAATLLEVGFNHFFQAPREDFEGDQIFFQGHASPGIYARAFLEGRLTEQHLEHFRTEVQADGLSSYPHPWLMPDFWQYPTVSMGLTSIQAIYQARFARYLEDRGLKPKSDAKIWAFMGDGEMDEPESLGAITLASREKLDNLIFVVNCNLQRLDGPVRGNGKIIQELEAAFRGAGWNVIKVVWGRAWDPLLERDSGNLLIRRMEEAVDGDYQKYVVESGAYIREHFFGKYPELLKLVEHYSDEELQRLNRGGHDPVKVYNAYRRAVEHRGAPTVILAKTIKGYGLGEAGEGRNITHQQKKLNEEELIHFRNRFGIPISDDEVAEAPFYKPPDDSPVLKYMRERREALGGYLPQRRVRATPLEMPEAGFWDEFFAGSDGRPVSTTMAFVRVMAKLLKDPHVGRLVVPIVPDEARTFGMEALFRQAGIYSHAGQIYEPVDRENLLYYKEATDGQILEEGITEAGSMASFMAAGSAYATYGLNMIPMYIFYSMFGFQRIGDLIWAAADRRCKGFLVGGTAGRTTLNGEGLQHQDGHSHVLALPVPTCMAYDPAFAYEIAIIVREGIRRMYVEQEDLFYYLTVENENYAMPPAPETDELERGVLAGLYRYRFAADPDAPLRVQLLGSGPILNEVIRAAELLAEHFDVQADVWSVTSYKELRRDALDVDRWNMLHPDQPRRSTWIEQCLADAPGPIVAASDHMKVLPDSVARWFPRRLYSLGTEGFGRSDTREVLRDFFEVDARFIALAALSALRDEGAIATDVVTDAIRRLDIDPDKPNPMHA
ncbi:MAG: pyruvate dehydrogenase (acetyl-transferring), homodimeric type [Candidatus Dadabacteria bacterium]|nr:MAG: pyruvate dehydrogenase (acetyl-transferring), homodimeric type [Candidatus Dadabacteria bacterium]